MPPSTLLYGDYSYRHFAVHRANLLRVNAGGGGSDQGSSSIPIAWFQSLCSNAM
ncbi:hypothetical protein NEUTE2DRAFT_142722 [Neurospora tetrasperma FGSC 2509]|nr:hypothetical protein NEUTE2DRAFT_142722 [Neurospora tetrasperma FGSC 2509]